MQHGWLLWSFMFLSVMVHASVPLGGPRKVAGTQTDLFGCLQTNPYYAVNFAAYPADLKLLRERQSLQPWCQDLPRMGLTHIVVDLLDRDVRHKPVALRIVDSQGRIIAQTEPTVAKTGVISTIVDLTASGHYEVVVIVHDDELKIPPETSALHIPIHAGLVSGGPDPNQIMLALATLMGGLVLILALALPKLMAKPKPVL